MKQLVHCNTGIDISKDEFSAMISGNDSQGNNFDLGHHCFKNAKSDFKAFLSWSNKQTQQVGTSFTLEFTGRYSEALAHFLFNNNQAVHMVSPFKSKRFRESYDADIKTDDRDALTLATMGLERQLPLWKPDSKFFSDLKIITRERSAIIKQCTALKNRKHALSLAYSDVTASVKRIKLELKLLRCQIREIDLQIKTYLQTDAIVWQKAQNVETIPGIGLTTIACVLAETDGFNKVTSTRRLAAFAGYKVTIKQSGNYKGQSHISKRGNKFIRRAMHMPTLSVIQCNTLLSPKYKALKARKAKPIIATTAMERKTLLLMYSIYKNDTIFDAKYENTKKDEVKV
jgi:transposase